MIFGDERADKLKRFTYKMYTCDNKHAPVPIIKRHGDTKLTATSTQPQPHTRTALRHFNVVEVENLSSVTHTHTHAQYTHALTINPIYP